MASENSFVSSKLITVSSCNLNQWSLDFSGNLERIFESCKIAKERRSNYRLGPELEICGYGCEDHYFEMDTFEHCWDSLVELIERGATDDDLLCDFGMPVLHKGVRYNCRILCKNRKILLIRPKRSMADGGNYRESRYFTAFPEGFMDEYILPKNIQQITNQRKVPFGVSCLEFEDEIRIGCETCEELWTPQSTHIEMSLLGVDIIGNGSGSHHELRKLNSRLELMIMATKKCGGVYLYANQRGCDGGRLYFDGCAMIVCNGEILAQGDQFSLKDVDVITATIDLNDVSSYRASIPSFGVQAAERVSNEKSLFVSCDNDCFQSNESIKNFYKQNTIISLRKHLVEEECCYGPACWLWDYLRRSGASGYFLPLSGGADSSATATIVAVMCVMVYKNIKSNPSSSNEVAQDLRRICGKPSSWVPSSYQEITHQILHTCFMGTSNSSNATSKRSKKLAEQIGAYHLNIQIDILIRAALKVFNIATGGAFVPKYKNEGGKSCEDLALQNIQARMRMVMSYMFAQLLPWTRSQNGFLLVLGSSNVDEALRGYFTKYDCSSADVNPIGAISKLDLKRMLLWALNEYQWDALDEICHAKPTAELRPISLEEENEHDQTDEQDMGMTYHELGVFGTLRKAARCGPVSMFRKLLLTWNHLYIPTEIAQKVKSFFYYYSVNRHKMTTVTPSYHAENYSPDDNRFDLRPFLYNTKWVSQFAKIDSILKLMTQIQPNRNQNVKTVNQVEDLVDDKDKVE